MNSKHHTLVSEAFAMANAREDARLQKLREVSEAQAKLVVIFIMRTVVLLGIGALTYFCGPKVGLGTLAVVYFFFS